MPTTVQADSPSTDDRDDAAEPPRRPPRAALLTQPPYRNAAVVITIAVTMVSIFAVSYTLALDRPTPHNIPAAVVGHPAHRPGVIPALKPPPATACASPYASLARAKHAINQQRIYAALALTGQSAEPVRRQRGRHLGRPRAGAGCPGGARRAGGPLQIVDLHPLPPTDPQGLASFYATLAATILGFVTMFQLRANAESLSLRAWLVCILVLALGRRTGAGADH